MKLTNAIKDSIINAVMQDTPEEYTHDQYCSDCLKLAVQLLPKEVRNIYDNKSTRPWVKSHHVWSLGLYLPFDSDTPTPEMKLLKDRRDASEKAMRGLKSHVHNVVYQFSTDKQMLQHVPELEKYLPKATEKTQNLPATNMIAELVKAGWPKGK